MALEQSLKTGLTVFVTFVCPFLSVCLSIIKIDNSKSYNVFFMKFAVTDHHQNMSLDFNC